MRTSRRQVPVQIALAGLGTDAILDPLPVEGTTEPFTHFARESVASDSPNRMKKAGYYMHASAVQNTETDVPRLSGRGYPMKRYLANADETLSDARLIALAQEWCDVSDRFVGLDYFNCLEVFVDFAHPDHFVFISVHERKSEKPVRVLQVGCAANPLEEQGTLQVHRADYC